MKSSCWESNPGHMPVFYHWGMTYNNWTTTSLHSILYILRISVTHLAATLCMCHQHLIRDWAVVEHWRLKPGVLGSYFTSSIFASSKMFFFFFQLSVFKSKSVNHPQLPQRLSIIYKLGYLKKDCTPINSSQQFRFVMRSSCTKFFVLFQSVVMALHSNINYLT